MSDAVRQAAQLLAEHDVPSPETDAIALAAHVVGCDPAELHRRMVLGDAVPADWDRFEELVAERARRIPLQHLTGRAGFRRLELAVGPGVFVPRPETELTAELAIAAAHETSRAVVVDLCTGSGAIALSVKDEVPLAQVYAVELSPEAHAWALQNRERTGLDVELRLGDAAIAFPELAGRVDVVVCNPPYIPEGMVPTEPEVRDHDPELALYGGSLDGLAVPLALAARAADLLRDEGALVMEHADVQGTWLPDALERAGVWREVADHKDLTGRPRVVTAHRVPRDG
ncbi:MAG TPA: peptide chain release factor N(5)-glutamine methyltransferase [Segeticoccus sp.]|uniref:peptide chain release factor N(5)-glutamine methyltransferase n=1 Tax=Segeticoccus sp. TaxID=2706531 RepID=UPI002D7F1F94|nr:peptide chain release factor N(5)-glutamine methyltransferase [Segeticoccus sp.]HET8601045.1 peptide chain release factor N(5)-glutamine methyltransferase [Segeticoccus sp.]